MSEYQMTEQKPCDYRRAECSNQGFLIDGKWHCIFHHPVAHRERTPAGEPAGDVYTWEQLRDAVRAEFIAQGFDSEVYTGGQFCADVKKRLKQPSQRKV